MATTEHFYSGTGTQTSFPFQFQYLTESDIFVKLYNSETEEFDLLQQNTSGLNHDYSISNTNIVFNTAPPQVAGIDNIHIYRTTDVEIAKAVYGTGSAIRAQDLNNNTNQALFRLQESDQLITTGDIKNGAITEAKLAPNSVTTVHIRNGTIIDEDVSATAAIHGSKIVPNFGVQNIVGDGSQIINPNPNFGNQTITTDLHITAQGNITAAGDLSIDDITASGDMTINAITAQGDIHARKFCGDGSCLTGITFDGIDQFLRRDIDDTASGTITFNDNIKIPAADGSSNPPPHGDLDGFDKGNIFWNYPEPNTGHTAFKRSAWIYLKERPIAFGSSITQPNLELHIGEYGGEIGANFTITAAGQANCIRFDEDGTNITNYPLRIHDSDGIQWEFRNNTPSFQIKCTDAFGSNADTYINNNRGTLFIKSNYDIEFRDNGSGSNDNGNTFFTSTLLKIKSYHDTDDELDLVNQEQYNGGHVELYSNNTKRFETDIFGCVVHSNLRIPKVSVNPSTDWNYDIFNADGYMWDNGSLIFGDKPNRAATSPNTPMDNNNWFYHNTATNQLEGQRNTTTFQLGAFASSQVPRGIFEINGNNQHLVTFTKLEKSGTNFIAPIEIPYSNVSNPDVDEGSSIKWGLHSLYGATKTPSLEIRCNNPGSTGQYANTSSYITNRRDDLYIQAGGVDGHGLIIEEFGSSPNTIAKFISDNGGSSGDALYGGAVELYAEGTKRFETNHTGGKLYGQLEVTGSASNPEILLQNDGPNIIRFSSTGAPTDQTDDLDLVYRSDPNTLGIERVSDTAILFTVDADDGNVQIPSDTGKLQLGASQDLELYHDGSGSFIKDSGTGMLKLLASTMQIRDGADSKTMGQFLPNGAATFFYDGAKKFETTADGTKISKEIQIEGVTVNAFESGRIRFTETNSDFNGGYIHYDGSANILKLGVHPFNDAVVGNDVDCIEMSRTVGSENVELNFAGSKKFETTDTGAELTGTLKVTATTTDPELLLAGAGPNIIRFTSNDAPTDNTDTIDLIYRATPNTLGFERVSGSKELFSVDADTEEVKIPNATGKLQLNTHLNIYRDANHAYIDHAAGALKIRSDTLRINDLTNDHAMIHADADNSVQLYYDNALKISTQNYGCLINGTMAATSNVRCQSDTHKITAGVGHDLEIYHDGTDSFIANSTGGLKILGDTIRLKGKSADENMIVAAVNGAAELYYDNAKKCYTGPNGLKFDDSSKALFGNSSDLTIWHSGSHSFIRHDAAATGNLYIDSLGTKNILIRSGDGSTGTNPAVVCTNAGKVALYYNGETKLETTSTGTTTTGIAIAGGIGSVGFKVPDSPLVTNETTTHGAFIAGNGNDLIIAHNGTNSVIENNTGILVIKSDQFRVRNNAGDEDYILMNADGAVKFTYDSVKKFETTSNGWKSEDNVKGTFGTDSDLEIYHDGSNSYITNTTGVLYIKADSTRDGIEIRNNGKVALFYQGNEKFQTKNTGAEVTGILTATGTGGISSGFKVPDNPSTSGEDTYGVITVGTGNDLEIYHDGTDSFISNTTGNLFINATSTETGIKVVRNGAIELYYNGGSPKFETTSNGWKTVDSNKGLFGTDEDLQIYHNGAHSILRQMSSATGNLYIDAQGTKTINIRSGNGSTGQQASVVCNAAGTTALYFDGSKKFETLSTGTKAYGSAHVVEGTSSTDFTIQTTANSSATTTLELRGSRTSSTTTAISKIDFTTADNGNTSVYDSTMPLGRISMFKQQGGTNRGRLKILLNDVSGDNLAVAFDLESDGDLTILGTVTDASDRRLKTDIVTISDALNKVNNLRGVEYTKIASGKKEIGVIAQEVQTVFPELVKTGDDEDKTLSVKYGHITAALIEAVKELTTEVNTLKTKVAALEAA